MEPYIGQIVLFPYNFVVRGWALCDGQLLAISQNNALFALLGTTYGGDGRTTFALPDLRGRVPVHMGQGAGLTHRNLGDRFGTEEVSLTVDQLPAHAHPCEVSTKVFTGAGNESSPDEAYPAYSPDAYSLGGSPRQFKSFAADQTHVDVNDTGSGMAHTNMQPSLTMSYQIALNGVFPSRE